MIGQLHSVLSPEAVSLLAQAFGPGRVFSVPRSTASPKAQKLEIILGLADTAALIDALGGCRVYLPGLPQADGRARGPTLAEVKRLSRTKSANEIAGLFSCSARTIYNKRATIKRKDAS